MEHGTLKLREAHSDRAELVAHKESRNSASYAEGLALFSDGELIGEEEEEERRGEERRGEERNELRGERSAVDHQRVVLSGHHSDELIHRKAT
jgi:hypothetical protein